MSKIVVQTLDFILQASEQSKAVSNTLSHRADDMLADNTFCIGFNIAASPVNQSL